MSGWRQRPTHHSPHGARGDRSPGGQGGGDVPPRAGMPPPPRLPPQPRVGPMQG